MQRKARRTLHIFVVPRARRFLGHRCCAFGCHAEKNLPSGSVVSASGLSSNSQAAYTRNSGKQSYRSHGTNGANCFSLKELGGIEKNGFEPETPCPNPSISGENRINSR